MFATFAKNKLLLNLANDTTLPTFTAGNLKQQKRKREKLLLVNGSCWWLLKQHCTLNQDLTSYFPIFSPTNHTPNFYI